MKFNDAFKGIEQFDDLLLNFTSTRFSIFFYTLISPYRGMYNLLEGMIDPIDPILQSVGLHIKLEGVLKFSNI